MSALKAYCDGYLTRQQFIEAQESALVCSQEHENQLKVLLRAHEAHPQAKTGQDTNEQ